MAMRAMAFSPAFSGKGDGHGAVFLARGPDRDFNVLAEGGQEGHQALDGEIAGTVAHEQGYLRLGDADDVPGLRLGELARLDNVVYLQGQSRLQLFLLDRKSTRLN